MALAPRQQAVVPRHRPPCAEERKRRSLAAEQRPAQLEHQEDHLHGIVPETRKVLRVWPAVGDVAVRPAAVGHAMRWRNLSELILNRTLAARYSSGEDRGSAAFAG